MFSCALLTRNAEKVRRNLELLRELNVCSNPKNLASCATGMSLHPPRKSAQTILAGQYIMQLKIQTMLITNTLLSAFKCELETSSVLNSVESKAGVYDIR